MCSVCRSRQLQVLMLSCMLTHNHTGSIVQDVPWKAQARCKHARLPAGLAPAAQKQGMGVLKHQWRSTHDH